MSEDNETFQIFVWADDSWVSEEDIDDMDWYLSSAGKSDDYATYDIPLGLEAEDIDELIELKALPGMLKNPLKLEDEGIMDLPKNSVLILRYKGETPYVHSVTGKMIINTTQMSIEILKGGK